MNPTLLPKKWLLATALLCVIACAPGDPPPSPRPSPPPAPVPSPPAIETPPAPAPPVVETPPAPKPVRRKKYPVLYLEPDHFPEAPPELRQGLTEHGCRIPQTYDAEMAGLEYEPEFEQTPEPPPIFLEGLEDGLAGKGSSIRYWHNCQWITLQGGD
jgi:hypothetical protein